MELNGEPNQHEMQQTQAETVNRDSSCIGGRRRSESEKSRGGLKQHISRWLWAENRRDISCKNPKLNF